MGWDDEFRFRDCPWCGLRDAQMHVLSPGGLTAGRFNAAARHWAAMSCPRCGGIVMLEVGAPQSSPVIMMTIPEEDAAARVNNVPQDVLDYYRGAIRVLDAGVPDAAAVQLRRTLEAAAAHFEIDTGPLIQRIKKLIEAGLITKDFGKVLDHVREVGNVGAHASDVRVDEETARRALRFTTAVLRNLFEIPAELAALEQAAAEPET
jgi:hypothetical protein